LQRQNSIIVYDAFSLYDFVSCTADVRDPVARVAMTSDELSRLASVCDSESFPPVDGLYIEREADVTHDLVVDFLLNDVVESSSQEMDDLVDNALTNLRTFVSGDAEWEHVCAVLSSKSEELREILQS